MALNWNKYLLGFEDMVNGVMILWIGFKLKYFLDFEEMVNGVKILMDWFQAEIFSILWRHG